MTLVIMAAGMGSRFGGLKQIEPVGPNGEFIIDYSIYDAIKAGFNKVVFIIKEENLEVLKEYAYKMLKNTGHEEISLSSLSSSDYSSLEELVTFLIDEFKGKAINISLPSLRIDAFSLDVMSKVQDIRKSSLTFAPEAGSQRLRDVINKGLTEEIILEGAGQAFEGGWSRVKLYFMLGLPTETEEDIVGIAELSNKIAATFFEVVPKEGLFYHVLSEQCGTEIRDEYDLIAGLKELTTAKIISIIAVVLIQTMYMLAYYFIGSLLNTIINLSLVDIGFLPPFL